MIVSRMSADGRPIPNWLLVYAAGIVGAEIALLLDLRTGAAIHAGLLLVLASHNAFGRTPKDPQLPALALLPLLRLLAIVMPVAGVDPSYWYALIGAPAVFAIAWTAHDMGLDPSSVGLGRPRSARLQAIVAAAGVPIGVLLATVGFDLSIRGDVPLPVAILIAAGFVVLVEELLVRGLLQHTARIRSPRLALVIPNVIYAAMYLGNGEAAVVMGVLGFLASVAVARTGSLWGVMGAHLIIRVIATALA